MDFAKEINDVVRKSINQRNLSDNYEDSVAYSESLCNELADKISKLVEEKFTSTNSAMVPCQHVLDGGTNGGQYECVKCGALFESM